RGGPTRRKFSAARGRMHTGPTAARSGAGAVPGGGPDSAAPAGFSPPFPWLSLVADVLQGSQVSVGGQNCHFATEGPYTGEVSPAMLLDSGCKYVIVGHSERRHGLGEPDAFLNRTVKAATEAGRTVIFF